MKRKTKRLVVIAMLSAIAFILMRFLAVPIYFLELDASDIPALLGGIIYGPLTGVVIEALKNFLDYLFKGSFTGLPIGQFANFTAGILLVVPVSYIVRRNVTLKNLVLGFGIGIAIMTAFMMVFNYYVFIPLYKEFLVSGGFLDNGVMGVITAIILPFNVVKGLLIAVVFVLLFKKIKFWIEKEKMNAEI